MQFFLKIMQFAIVILVVGSNGQYHWTPNGYVAGLVGLFAALMATVLIIGTRNLVNVLIQKFGNQRISGNRTIR